MKTSAHTPPFPAPPKQRGEFRMAAGKAFFSFRRYLSWLGKGQSFASQRSSSLLPFVVSSHQTPLLRPLGKDSMSLQYNKIINLRLTLPKINGLILHPEQTFSFWYLVGKPTRKKGYVEGMVLHNGKCCPGVGGGLCQLSNLIYWLTVHTPLTVTERWRHNYDVFPDADRTQPFGSGATVVYNYVDLQICNHTSESYQLLLSLDDKYLCGSWVSSSEPSRRYEVYESQHLIQSQWWGGYTRSNVLRRKITDREGIPISDEFVCSNEAIMMYEPLLASASEPDS